MWERKEMQVLGISSDDHHTGIKWDLVPQKVGRWCCFVGFLVCWADDFLSGLTELPSFYTLLHGLWVN